MKRYLALLMIVVLVFLAFCGSENDIYEEPREVVPNQAPSVSTEPSESTSQSEQLSVDQGDPPESASPVNDEIALPLLTSDEVKKLHERFPYRMIVDEYVNTNSYWQEFTLGDDMAKRIESALWPIIQLGNVPHEDFDSIESDTAAGFVVNASCQLTTGIREESDPDAFHKISEFTSPYSEILLKGHVERTAATVFGKDGLRLLQPELCWYASFDPYSDTFSFGGMGYWYTSVPIVLSHTESGTNVTATVVILIIGPSEMGPEVDGGAIWEGGNIVVTDIDDNKAVNEYIQQKAIKHSFTFEKGEGGRLYLRSHHILS